MSAPLTDYVEESVTSDPPYEFERTSAHAATAEAGLPWIQVCGDAPYFATEDGHAWTPVGQNDGIEWIELRGLYRRRDYAGVERYLRSLRAHGVTCLRLMLEYCHRGHRYFERPGWPPARHMVRFWDDLFVLCERHRLRILLTPFDTFFMWKRWEKHPYNQRNGGPCASRDSLLLCKRTRMAIKERLRFAVERWGASGALFAWDLWNELHPAYAGERVEPIAELIDDLSHYVRALERRSFGRTHPQTASAFAPELSRTPALAPIVFGHPALDFATTHLYEEGTIDFPTNTVHAAIAMGRLTRESIAQIPDARPYFDSEHGPIHTFKDHRITLPEPFDDEYFRHMQWAHLASGGAGGGMRWPDRVPHQLTRGMRESQRAMAKFLPLVDWTRFRRRALERDFRLVTEDGDIDRPLADAVAVFGCADADQAVVWLLRTDRVNADGMVRQDCDPITPVIEIAGLRPGRWRVTAWSTRQGEPVDTVDLHKLRAGPLVYKVPPFAADIALALRAE